MLRPRFVACAQVLLQVLLLILVVENLHDGKWSPKLAPIGLPVGPEPPYGTGNDPADAGDVPRLPKFAVDVADNARQGRSPCQFVLEAY